MKKKLLLLLPLLLLAGCTSNADEYEDYRYGIKNRVKVGEFVYVINSVNNTKHSGSDILGKDAKDNYVLLNISVKNNGKKTNKLTSDMMTYYANEVAYYPNEISILLESPFYLELDIESGQTSTINVPYETPKESTTEDYLLVKAPGKSKETMKIYMGAY